MRLTHMIVDIILSPVRHTLETIIVRVGEASRLRSIGVISMMIVGKCLPYERLLSRRCPARFATSLPLLYVGCKLLLIGNQVAWLHAEQERRLREG